MAKEATELWTLTKPITLTLTRAWGDRSTWQTEANQIMVEAGYKPADEKGLITVTVIAFIPYKSERMPLYDLRGTGEPDSGLGGAQEVRIRESLIQSIQKVVKKDNGN